MKANYRIFFDYDNERKHVDFYVNEKIRNVNSEDIECSAEHEIEKNGYYLIKCSNKSKPGKINVW
jgi:hypothetical protein